MRILKTALFALVLLSLNTSCFNDKDDDPVVKNNEYNEINDFVTQHGCVPAKNMANITEYMLASRLEAMKANPEQYMALADYDEHNLLPQHQD